MSAFTIIQFYISGATFSCYSTFHFPLGKMAALNPIMVLIKTITSGEYLMECCEIAFIQVHPDLSCCCSLTWADARSCARGKQEVAIFN